MIIDPVGFGDDVVAWANQMTYLVQDESPNCLILTNPAEWRDWALCLVAQPDQIGQDAPDPNEFDTWQEWAMRFFQTTNFSG